MAGSSGARAGSSPVLTVAAASVAVVWSRSRRGSRPRPAAWRPALPATPSRAPHGRTAWAGPIAARVPSDDGTPVRPARRVQRPADAGPGRRRRRQRGRRVRGRGPRRAAAQHPRARAGRSRRCTAEEQARSSRRCGGSGSPPSRRTERREPPATSRRRPPRSRTWPGPPRSTGSWLPHWPAPGRSSARQAAADLQARTRPLLAATDAYAAGQYPAASTRARAAYAALFRQGLAFIVETTPQPCARAHRRVHEPGDRPALRAR